MQDEGSERQAIIDHGARLIALHRADYTRWDKLRCLTNQWPSIARMLAEPGPAALTVSLSSASPETF